MNVCFQRANLRANKLRMSFLHKRKSCEGAECKEVLVRVQIMRRGSGWNFYFKTHFLLNVKNNGINENAWFSDPKPILLVNCSFLPF